MLSTYRVLQHHGWCPLLCCNCLNFFWDWLSWFLCPSTVLSRNTCLQDFHFQPQPLGCCNHPGWPDPALCTTLLLCTGCCHPVVPPNARCLVFDLPQGLSYPVFRWCSVLVGDWFVWYKMHYDIAHWCCTCHRMWTPTATHSSLPTRVRTRSYGGMPNILNYYSQVHSSGYPLIRSKPLPRPMIIKLMIVLMSPILVAWVDPRFSFKGGGGCSCGDLATHVCEPHFIHYFLVTCPAGPKGITK